jgi:hypothetical protein
LRSIRAVRVGSLHSNVGNMGFANFLRQTGLGSMPN